MRARVEVTVIPFPVPATSHAACGFAALRAPAPFTSPVMRRVPAFAVTHSPRLRSCSVLSGFISPPLPSVLTQTSCAVRLLRSAGVTPHHRYYEPSRRRLVFSRFPDSAGYTTYLAPPIARWDEDGFSSCSACPCHRAAPNHPAEVASRLGQPAACHVAFAPKQRARPSESYFVEATTGFTCVAAR